MPSPSFGLESSRGRAVCALWIAASCLGSQEKEIRAGKSQVDEEHNDCDCRAVANLERIKGGVVRVETDDLRRNARTAVCQRQYQNERTKGSDGDVEQDE